MEKRSEATKHHDEEADRVERGRRITAEDIATGALARGTPRGTRTVTCVACHGLGVIEGDVGLPMCGECDGEGVLTIRDEPTWTDVAVFMAVAAIVCIVICLLVIWRASAF